MAARADTYSRVVRTLKVLLPLGALGLLSTLFFFSGEVDPAQSIPYRELNVEQLAREQRITAPYLAGVTPDGVAVTLSGAFATPDLDGREGFRMEELSARFVTADNLSLDAEAPMAEVDQGAGTALLSGGTRMHTSDGMRIETEGVLANLETAELESTGPILAEAPFGRLTAQKMSVARNSTGSDYTIVFQGDVKLVYQQSN